MIDNGILGFPFGCYFGMVFEAYKFPNLHTTEVINDVTWKKLVRFIVGILLCVPILCLGIIPGQYNIYLMMIIKRFIPTFVSGFIIYGLSDEVNRRIKLLQFSADEQKIFYGYDNESAL